MPLRPHTPTDSPSCNGVPAPGLETKDLEQRFSFRYRPPLVNNTYIFSTRIVPYLLTSPGIYIFIKKRFQLLKKREMKERNFRNQNLML